MYRLRTEKLHLGLCSVNIDLNLFDAFHFVLRHFSLLKEVLQVIKGDAPEIVLYHIIIFFSLSLECVSQYFLIIRNIVEKELPDVASVLRSMHGTTVPRESSKFLKVDHLLREDSVELFYLTVIHASLNFIKLVLLLFTFG